ncbi:PREDICTED: uncharacterized protein LOC109327396 isoform X1 [Lupinus angustifolius]|uniref:uncharacterized protein LOC109327396 isoform X1 n=1 Tax=Lupinus angustifolius TaxID=3871 RepID=UPI00092ECE14|nr:PREDICTED: uncharacterized protein LOC109327396 isoform X1 [Lupinus angustifolius]XP_019416070.1 PREDICTED: uncharacterized protein LOC109327396 isoform X1 [Lupinus angustifolius]XP_019416071.1 PREDICTED: uncharacterized protein LOC109327396 isoform X1 [Lupinus angustifolius]
MDAAFSHLAWWLWSRKNQEPILSNGSSTNSSADSGVKELDALRFHLINQAKVPSSSTRVKQKWYSREENKIDREYDVVLVPSDVGCVSGSESDDSDWSIGWLEPHGAEFSSGDDESRETDNSFAVLVPCYGSNYSGMEEEDPKSNLLINVGNFPDGYSEGDGVFSNNKYIRAIQNVGCL